MRIFQRAGADTFRELHSRLFDVPFLKIDIVAAAAAAALLLLLLLPPLCMTWCGFGGIFWWVRDEGR